MGRFIREPGARADIENEYGRRMWMSYGILGDLSKPFSSTDTFKSEKWQYNGHFTPSGKWKVKGGQRIGNNSSYRKKNTEAKVDIF